MKLILVGLLSLILSSLAVSQVNPETYSVKSDGMFHSLHHIDKSSGELKPITAYIYKKIFIKNHFTIDNEFLVPALSKDGVSYNFIQGDGEELFAIPVKEFDLRTLSTVMSRKKYFVFNYINKGSFYYNFTTKEKKDFPSHITETKFERGYALVSEDTKKELYGLYTKTGEEILPIKFTSISVPYSRRFNVAAVFYNGQSGNLYNLTTNKYVFQEDLIYLKRVGHSRVIFKGVTSDFRLFEMDEKYNINYIDDFSERKVSVEKEVNNLKICTFNKAIYGAYDQTGKNVIPFAYQSILPINENVLLVGKFTPSTNSTTYGFIDNNNNIISPIDKDFIGERIDGMIKVKKDGKFGFANNSGKIVIACKYETANDFKSGQAYVSTGGSSFLIDKQGNPIDQIVNITESNMLLSHSFIASRKGFSRGEHENIFVWDKKTGKNRTYAFSYPDDKVELYTSERLEIPSEYLNDLIGEGDLRIEMSINKNVIDPEADNLSHNVVYTALAYNTKSGKAKIFVYQNGTFVYKHNLDAAPINNLKEYDGEIRMKIDAIPTGRNSNYAYVGLITAWNTKSGKNCSFIQRGPRHTKFIHWKDLVINIPHDCIDISGNIMMNIASYHFYGISSTTEEIIYNHFVYNTHSQKTIIQTTKIKDDQFDTGNFPEIAWTNEKPKKIDIINSWNKKHLTNEVYISYSIMNYQDNYISPAVMYINAETGLGYCGVIESAIPHSFLKPGPKDYTSIKAAIARIKGNSSITPSVVAFVHRASATTFYQRYIIYNSQTGDVEILDYDIKDEKYNTFVTLKDNALFE